MLLGRSALFTPKCRVGGKGRSAAPTPGAGKSPLGDRLPGNQSVLWPPGWPSSGSRNDGSGRRRTWFTAVRRRGHGARPPKGTSSEQSWNVLWNQEANARESSPKMVRDRSATEPNTPGDPSAALGSPRTVCHDRDLLPAPQPRSWIGWETGFAPRDGPEVRWRNQLNDRSCPNKEWTAKQSRNVL
jgi:hypothetical protein